VASRPSWRSERCHPVQPAALAGAFADGIGALDVVSRCLEIVLTLSWCQVAVAICGWEFVAEATRTDFWRAMLLVLPQILLLAIIVTQFFPVLTLRMLRLVRETCWSACCKVLICPCRSKSLQSCWFQFFAPLLFIPASGWASASAVAAQHSGAL
jgi:hypothetical protein